METTQQPKTGKSGWLSLGIKILKYGIVVLALGYLLWSGKLDPKIFTNALHHPLPILIGITFTFIPMLVSFVRYNYLLKALDINLGLGEVTRLGFIGCFFNTFMLGGMGGDVVKVAYIMKDTGKRSPVIASALIDRVLGMMGVLALGGGAMLLAFDKVVSGTADLQKLAISVFTVLAVVCCCAFCSVITLTRGRAKGFLCWGLLLLAGGIALYKLQSGIPFIPIQHPGEEIEASILMRSRFSISLASAVVCSLLCIIIVPSCLPGHRLEKFVSNTLPGGKMLMSLVHALLMYRNSLLTLGVCFLLSLITHSFNMLSLYFFAGALDLAASPTVSDIFFAAPVSYVINSLPMPGGGVAIGESAFGTLLSLCQTAGGEPITGGYNIFLLWRFWYIILGLIGLPFYLRGKCDIVAAEQEYKEHEEEIAESLDETPAMDESADKDS